MLFRGLTLSTLAAVLVARSASSQDEEEQGWTYQVQSSYQSSDYLPLAVGNSWTYVHLYIDARSWVDAPSFPDWEAMGTEQERRFSISVLRKEVIDGETFFVISNGPESGWPPMPRYFIGGKKLRWNGNNLIEHDGTSEVVLYQFRVPTAEEDFVSFNYSILSAPTSVEASTTARNKYRIPRQQLIFPKTDDEYTPSMMWLGGFGLIQSAEYGWDDDWMIFGNEITAYEALLYAEDDGGRDSTTSDDGESGAKTSRRVTYRDAVASFLGYGPGVTSTRSSSWGNIKSRTGD